MLYEIIYFYQKKEVQKHIEEQFLILKHLSKHNMTEQNKLKELCA